MNNPTSMMLVLTEMLFKSALHSILPVWLCSLYFRLHIACIVLSYQDHIQFISSICSYLTSSTMQVNSSGVMPIIFSTSSLAIPGTLARFTGLAPLKTAAVALNPGGKNCNF